MKYIKNKRGWIKIVEALVAILLIAGVVLIAINQSQGKREDLASRIHNDQIAILRDIQLNNSLREEIVATSGTIEWSNFPVNLKNRIETKTPNYLECEAKICLTSDVCVLANSEEKSIYAESVIITATLQTYNPRQLKLFCWEKN